MRCCRMSREFLISSAFRLPRQDVLIRYTPCCASTPSALRAKMEPDQLARYEMAFNDHTKTIQPQRINEVSHVVLRRSVYSARGTETPRSSAQFLQSKYGYEVSRDLGMVISILGKTHIGEMVERGELELHLWGFRAVSSIGMLIWVCDQLQLEPFKPQKERQVL